MAATDVTGFYAIFSTGFFATFSRFSGALLIKLHIENLEKEQKIQWRASSGDGAPKLQISVPCRGRIGPEPLSKAKSGNLNLFLRILPFFPLLFPVFCNGKKANSTEKGLDYQILLLRLFLPCEVISKKMALKDSLGAFSGAPPEGPKDIEKCSRSPSGIEIFTRECQSQASHPLRPSFPCFFWIPCLFPLRGIPCFSERFSLLFLGFLGFGGNKNPCFSVVFPCLFQKKQRKRKDRALRPFFLWGDSEGRDWHFQARMKFSSKIVHVKRDS